MSSPLVSVVMPTWNRERLIGRAIDSVREQSFQDWELIVVDDGSDDGTAERMAAFVCQDSRIRYVRQAHGGYSRAINRGCQEARGEFIAFQDDDDRSLPGRFAQEVALLRAEPQVELVYGLARWVDDKGQTIRQFPEMLLKSDFRGSQADGLRVNLWHGCKIVTVSVMMRRRHLDGVAEVFAEMLPRSSDWLHHLELCASYRIVGLSQVLVEVNRDPAHASMMSNQTLVLDGYRRVLNLAEHRLRSRLEPAEFRIGFRRAWAHQFMLESAVVGGWRGAWCLAQALCRWPGHPRAGSEFRRYLTFPWRRWQQNVRLVAQS